LKDLPYAHPERMDTIYARITGPDASDGRSGIDGEKWELLRDNVPSLISAVSGGISGVNLLAGGRAQYVQNARISAYYLDVLAIQPLLGRNFSQDEDRPHGPKVAILSYSLWLRTRDHSILSRHEIGLLCTASEATRYRSRAEARPNRFGKLMQ
jgi:macrolide transport system ATP-binding/permease protein